MEFDHVKGVKRMNVGNLVTGGYSEKSIIEEIEKCDLVCANCHRMRTFDDNGNLAHKERSRSGKEYWANFKNKTK